jgi:deoxyribose-phosphate aldolase
MMMNSTIDVENLKGDKLAKMLDHTLLKTEATAAQVKKLCAEAREYKFATVIVHPTWTKLIVSELKGSGVKPGIVVGFPMGANIPEVKAFETKMALEQGAQEIDMVLNIGALKSSDLDLVERDVRAVVDVAHAGGALVKVIIECCLLTDDEKVTACKLCQKAGADFVKTSTGLSTGGATVHDVELMRKTVGPQMGVKAAGGIRTYEEVIAMIKAGATRIGTSAGMQIVKGPSKPGEKPGESKGY